MTTEITPAQPQPVAPAPLWIRVWLALLAPLYFFAPVAVFALPTLRRLPRPVWWVLGFYAVTQQLPALLTPEPLINSGLALARTLLMFSFVALGASLNSTRQLAPLGVGLAVVYVTALGLTGIDGLNPLSQRLGHPYMTPITLGLAGAAGIWMALFAGGKLWWRVPLGTVALGILLLSGSRGPLLAALLGMALGFAVRQSRRVALGILAGAALLAGGFYAGTRLDLPAINRLSNSDTSGRDLVWNNALSVIRSEPISGVGSYRLGARLSPPGEKCTLWPAPDGTLAPCPAWIDRLGQPWLIAHNVTLQQLAETGPLGLLGLFVLLGVGVAAAWRQRDPLGIAVLAGLLVATANDNTLIVPGPFVGELFWVTIGSVLARMPQRSPAVGWAGGAAAAGLLAALSFPLLVGALRPAPTIKASLDALIAPRNVQDTQNYQAFVRLNLPPGPYRVSLRACQSSCSTIITLPVTAPASGPTPLLKLGGNLYDTATQRVELLVYPGEGSVRPQPLAQTSWTVTRTAKSP
ncbi:O-antigen ligase family protein [Deinococcus sp. AJ005]|uniref:O-antigen ligase family protein n=1 Tax=Deinococcus sp. AJ005 TaxID=2652443 RepID=UPI00125CC2E3|nr:O-antigen ligase family protein [Deinococcus sp. AJ005]QFP78122.1 O-antigen ligase domain-containing protein [Deinococcus sp. AJ005]